MAAKEVVAWLTTNLKFFFDGIACDPERIDQRHAVRAAGALSQGILARGVLSAVHDGGVHRRRLAHPSLGRVTLFTLFGLLVIYNQGYWKETMETLALVLAATGVSMVWAFRSASPARAAPGSTRGSARPRPHADDPHLRLSHSGAHPVRLGMVPGLIATVIFAIPAPIRLTRLGIISTHRLWSKPPKPSGRPSEGVDQSGAAFRDAADHGGPDADHHAVAVDGRHRRAGRRQRSRRACGARAQHRQHRQGVRFPASAS